MDNSTIEQAILDLVTRRGAGKSACPSEVARALRPTGWRDVMPQVRKVVNELQRAGRIDVTQKGVSVDAHSARGAIRLTVASRPTT